MSGGKVELTVDDVIATLKNSSLPSVIVEGRDDLVVYRRIEEIDCGEAVSVFPIGGQNKVLELFRRRAELGKGSRVAFVADRDRWVFEGVPRDLAHKELIFTEGYSIENDIIRDGAFNCLMTPGEGVLFEKELNVISKWFALAMSNFLHGKPESLSTYPGTILEIANSDEILSDMLESDGHASSIFEEIDRDPLRMIRGKTVMSLIIRQVGSSGRIVRHHSLSLMDIVGAKPGHYVATLFANVLSALGLVRSPRS